MYLFSVFRLFLRCLLWCSLLEQHRVDVLDVYFKQQYHRFLSSHNLCSSRFREIFEFSLVVLFRLVLVLEVLLLCSDLTSFVSSTLSSWSDAMGSQVRVVLRWFTQSCIV